MLLELKIRNLAVVEDATLDFSSGMNVLTGSTGAGKSIILTAVDLLSGARGRKSLLRKGAEALSLEGIFAVPAEWGLRGMLGMDEEEGTVSIRREIRSDGRSRIWVNGAGSTNATAREVTDSLLELHGQRRQQELLDPATHIGNLDDAGDYGVLLADAGAAVEDFRRCWRRLRELELEEERNREQEDYLKFQLSELEALGLEEGIDARLEKNIQRIENISRYRASVERSLALLSEDEGAVIDRLSVVEREMEYLSKMDDSWEGSASSLEEVRISVQDLARDLEKALSGEEEEGGLEHLQERLASIQRAKRKYRMDCEGLIARRDEIRDILESLEEGSAGLEDAEKELAAVSERLVPLLEELSDRRRKFAASLDRRMTGELQDLGMEGALFRTRIDRREIKSFAGTADELDLTAAGWDDVEFMIRTNTGEDIHPLAEVASGGELSRVTLVLKKFLASEKGVSTLIFDEIDSGLGADLGRAVADKLKELSAGYQIICITHLPQVAAVAGKHILIEKKVTGGRTSTTARVLEGEERTTELARMLGGEGRLRELLAGEMLDEGKSARSSAG